MGGHRQPRGHEVGPFKAEDLEILPTAAAVRAKPSASRTGEETEAITETGKVPTDNLGITCICEHEAGLFSDGGHHVSICLSSELSPSLAGTGRPRCPQALARLRSRPASKC